MTLLKPKISKTRNFPKRYRAAIERRNANPRLGHVYICRVGDNLYKIGRTVNLTARINSLSASNPFMKCIYSKMCSDFVEAEKFLHRIFRKNRVDREIFEIENINIQRIDKCLRKRFAIL